jgi:hypothetical protein
MHLDVYNCVLCSAQIEETLEHLFFGCNFSKWYWRFLNDQWNTNLAPYDMLLSARSQFGSKIFREVLIIGIWC